MKEQFAGAYLGIPFKGHNVILKHSVATINCDDQKIYWKNKKLHPYLYIGLMFPDIPCPSFKPDKEKTNVILNPGICAHLKSFKNMFYNSNFSSLKNFITEMLFGKKITSVSESHYGRKSYWHSMSPVEGKSLKEVAEGIIGRLGIIYQNALNSYQTDKKESFFSIGRILHTIQDAYSPGHVIRDSEISINNSSKKNKLTSKICVNNKESLLTELEIKNSTAYILRYLELKYTDNYKKLWDLYDNPNSIFDNEDLDDNCKTFNDQFISIFQNKNKIKYNNLKDGILRLIHDEQDKEKFKYLNYNFKWNNIDQKDNSQYITNFFSYPNEKHGSCDKLIQYEKLGYYNCTVHKSAEILIRFSQDIQNINQKNIDNLTSKFMDWLTINVYPIKGTDLENEVTNNIICSEIDTTNQDPCIHIKNIKISEYQKKKKMCNSNKYQKHHERYKKYKNKYNKLKGKKNNKLT